MKNNCKNSLLVSIIVPVYNTEKYLSTCIDSIINQTYKNLE
ncbi:MAG: glycosyltransferase, partial [Spirochaetia bacterium]|nr:glycosyltransferase [Spirochaetia bacterium]